MDTLLDQASFGPLWLKDSRVALIVSDALSKRTEALRFFRLHAFVVMPNHVHLLLTPRVSIRRIMNGLKGVTAREANKVLGRAGCHFWQDESFDHWMRNSGEFTRIQTYIEFNPVFAQLVARPADWRWSSAYREPQ